MSRFSFHSRAAFAGVRRRDFIRFGTLAALGSPRLAAAEAGTFGRAKRCILLFLTGGPPQTDSFDPKPDAPAEVRGELTTIPTRLPGVRFTELFPRLAAINDRLCLVRSVTHRDTVHTSAGYTMLTGVDHPLANTPTATSIKETPNDHPHLGSLLARYRPNRGSTPTFASLPEYIRDDAINDYPGQGGGLLGKSVDPFRLEANPERTAFDPPPIALPPEVAAERLSDRQQLRERLNRSEPLANRETDEYYRQSFELIGSTKLQEAFDLNRESERLRASYGNHLFGRSCLMGRRLLEAGVSLVSVYWHYEGPKDSPVWDTHGDNFPHLRKRLAPPTDRAVAALIADLDARGMLADTLVICMGEFGRTPKINALGGRDHWPGAQSILLAGAGVPAGGVVGATDRRGAFPVADPIAPMDLTATFLHLLGVAPGLELRDRTGRPMPVCAGKPVASLIGR